MQTAAVEQVWQVWASEPLTKDGQLMIRWSRTSYFEGCPVCKPNYIDGKDFFLYHKCSDEAWARERFEHARQYFKDVRLTLNGEEVDVDVSKPPKKPEDDMLGAYGSLSVRGGGC
jgi:hypothetical protein